MRINTFTLAVLATTAAARPRPVRREADVVTLYQDVTAIPVVTVDQYGNTIATTVRPVDAAYTNAAVGGAEYSTTSTTSSASPPVSTSPSYGDSTGDDGADSGYSIAYSPYHASHDCKTEPEIDADVDQLKNYDMIRIYGTDCDQVRIIMNAAKRNDMKVWAGIWHLDQAAAEAQILADGAKHDWSRIKAVSVGNELLNTTAVSDLTSAIGTARSVLEPAGYTGPVTTVDVWITLKERLADTSNGLCAAMDIIAANCHAFFDGGKTAEEAGNWVRQQADGLGDDCKNKDIVITESGWPSAGSANGLAVPGPDNQRTVINGLRTAFADKKDKMFLFSAFNDGWKTDNQWGVEHYWGIYGNAPSARR